jgi:glycosidase
MFTPEQMDWVPDWVRRAIFYHIYPLGFLDAPRHNDRQAQPVPRLAELRQWYDHITNLGVTAIYFGPLFESLSHGYDTVDYFTIDRRLGDIALFQQIVAELHERGIKVILDGVFNHTSREFFAFQDIRRHGRSSRYADWYLINWGADSAYQDGFAYESWEGHQSLPRLNLKSPAVRNYLFEVARMWLGDVGVDGWRLDVAYEIGPDFWWEFRRVCKQVKPDCFLLGEMIGGDYRVWVAPDLLDSGTDYQLYKAIWSSLNAANFWELKAVMERAFHPEWGVFKDLTLLTFLGNHDVTRILSQLNEPRHVYTALLILMSAPGVPCLYYGDEVGMRGRKEEGDVALRGPMPSPEAEWPDRERAIYREAARLAGIRKTHPSLLYGRFAPLEAGDTVFSFLRQSSRETAVVALNSGGRPVSLTCPVGREGVPDGTTFTDVLDPDRPAYTVQGGRLSVDKIWPYWGRILIAGN